MKLKFLFLFLFIANFCVAQDADSTKSNWDYGIVVGGGICKFNYDDYGNDNTEYFYNHLEQRFANNSNTQYYSNNQQNNFKLANSTACFWVGLQLNKKTDKVIKHLLSIGYNEIKGSYFSSRIISQGETETSVYSTYENVNNNFKLRTFKLLYIFQPTYMHMFLRVGSGFEINNISADRTSNITGEKKYSVTDFPFSIMFGTGGVINFKQFQIIPSYSFFPHMSRWTWEYQLHLSLLYKMNEAFKKREPKCHNW